MSKLKTALLLAKIEKLEQQLAVRDDLLKVARLLIDVRCFDWLAIVKKYGHDVADAFWDGEEFKDVVDDEFLAALDQLDAEKGAGE